MKKTLALVLALLMVLALVPTAFAADEYTVTAEISLVDPKTSVEAYRKTYSATGTQPDVKVEIPFDAIEDTEDASAVWNKYYKEIKVKLEGISGMTNSDFFGGEVESIKVEITGDTTETYKWSKKTTNGRTTQERLLLLLPIMV